MEEAALVERIDTEDEAQYRQTLNAAVEISLNFERQAFYLMASANGNAPEMEDAVVGMVEGARGADSMRLSGDITVEFPEEDTRDDADEAPLAERRTNGGADVDH